MSPSHPADEASAGEILAFRLRAHHLTDRRPANELAAVAGACGIQNSPPGSALLSLHARVDGVTVDTLDRLLGEDRTLLQTWSLRGAPLFFPTVDAPVFTTGVLPSTELARTQLIVGVESALTTLGMGLDEAVDSIAAQIGPVLTGRHLAIGPLGRELAERVADTLPPGRRGAWRAADPHRPDSVLGESVVHFCLRILALRGVVCIAPREGNTAPFVLVDEWLGRPLPRVDPSSARAELLRRYLRCYGPSTRKDFASWVGVRTGDVDPWWTTVEDELVPVDRDGSRGWILGADLDSLRTPAPPTRGVRLLPPGDPYTQLRDRDTLVDRAHHSQVWLSVGIPGTVLADGVIVGIWRPRKSGRTLTVTVTEFAALGAGIREQLRVEAESVARLRGASTVRVVFAE